MKILDTAIEQEMYHTTKKERTATVTDARTEKKIFTNNSNDGPTVRLNDRSLNEKEAYKGGGNIMNPFKKPFYTNEDVGI